MLGLDSEYMNIKTIKKVLYVVPDMPRQAVIEITNVCNLDCEMCPRKVFNRPNKHMDFETYKRIIDRLAGVEEIALIGYGEPLLHPRIFGCIRYARDRGFKVTMVTNGYPLRDKKLAHSLIYSGIDEIRISIDSIVNGEGGHPVNEEVIKSIERFKKELNKAMMNVRHGITMPINIKIIINPVLADWNYNTILSLLDWAEENGFNKVDIAHWNEICGLKSDLSPEEELDFYKKIPRMDYAMEVATLYDRYRGLRRLGFKFMTKCPMSYESVYIKLDGTVSPCSCGLPNLTWGNILEQRMEDIWTNDKFKGFRKGGHPTCKKCTLYKLET